VTLTYQLDIDILKIYMHAENEVLKFFEEALKVGARTGQTDGHARPKRITTGGKKSSITCANLVPFIQLLRICLLFIKTTIAN